MGGQQYGAQSRRPACLSSVEVFDATTGTWASLPSMSSCKIGAAFASIRNQIIVAGGRPAIGEQICRTVEMLDLEATRRGWVQLPDMDMEHSLAASCVFQVDD